MVELTTKEKFVNPFTDFGFKRLFGEEPNKDILIDFLNQLLYEEQGLITDLTYMKGEQLGSLDKDRRAIFDLYCENERGEKFIVEIQKAKQKFFKERTLFYSTFPIREQAEKGEWDYNLKAVYTIGILDFIFDEDINDPDKFLYKVKLKDDETNKVFYDKLTFIYIEMPKFNKTEEELETQFDKWLYVLRNLPNLQKRPAKLQEKIFSKLFEQAEVAGFTKEQLGAYEESIKIYRDFRNTIETARDEGRAEGEEIGIKKGEEIGIQKGRAEGEHLAKIEIAKNLLAQHVDLDVIKSATGLSADDIKKLRQ